MPTYDYLCAACGHTFERFESMGAGGAKACEKCGKKKAKRRMGTGAGLIFKGSGFYVTDYKNGGKKPEKAEQSEKSEPAAKTESKAKEKEPKK